MRNNGLKKYIAMLCAGLMGASLLLSGCGAAKESSASSAAQETSAAETQVSSGSGSEAAAGTVSASGDAQEAAVASSGSDEDKLAEAPEIPGLTCESVMDLVYAECFNVYYYNDGYKLIAVNDGRQYLVVPEDKDVPDGLDDSIIVLQQPLDCIYMGATSAMALFNAMDALDNVRLSSIEEDAWYVDAAAAAMKDGSIIYGGKYSKPDYELLVSEGCNLAIESTMILHSPKVQEMIEDLGIPVFIDHSSYESHPLGRTEWIKCYAAMLNKEDDAEAFFEKELNTVEELNDYENTGKTVAYFHINTEGQAVVRASADYIPKMIELAGGKYVFDDLKQDDDNKSATVTISMEEFYASAKDADYLIYNSSIEGPLASVDALIEKDSLFKDFKAVKDGNVWSTGNSLYQATDTVGEFILDIHEMITTGDESQMRFITKVN